MEKIKGQQQTYQANLVTIDKELARPDDSRELSLHIVEEICTVKPKN